MIHNSLNSIDKVVGTCPGTELLFNFMIVDILAPTLLGKWFNVFSVLTFRLNNDNLFFGDIKMRYVDKDIEIIYEKIKYCYDNTNIWPTLSQTSISITRRIIVDDYDARLLWNPHDNLKDFARWVDNNCHRDNAPFLFSLFSHDVGGVSGGSCWDSSDPQPYFNNEPAPILKPKDIRLLFGDTFINDIDFRIVVVQEREYYGNRTDTQYTGILLDDLYNILKAIEQEKITRNVTLLVGLPGCGKTTYGNLICSIGEGDPYFVDDASLHEEKLKSSISHKNIIIADPLLCELTRQEMVDSLTKMFPDYNLNVKVIWFEKDITSSLAICQRRDPFDSKRVEGLIKQLGKVYNIDPIDGDVVLPSYYVQLNNQIPTRNIFK